MPVDQERLSYLLRQNAAGACTREEMRELYQSIAQASEEELAGLLDEQYGRIDPDVEVKDIAWDQMFDQIIGAAPVVAMSSRPRRSWLRYVAAAAILVLVLGGYWYLYRLPNKGGKPMETIAGKDVKAPESNRATITLANGQTIYLDSASNGSLAMVDQVRIIKQADGKISYSGTAKEEVYNTLTNPRGSKVIDITLSDGTRVWLNAGSSLQYPAAFVGDERRVSISGEAYFEVAHVSSPVTPGRDTPSKGGQANALSFIVQHGDVSVTVLGTHFNVNAYADEPDIKVTLLEGRVRTAIGNGQSAMLKPGQQAVVHGSQLTVRDDVDMEEVMAWKNGKFSFNKDDIKTVMRQLARWYDLEVVYEGEVTTDKFWGDIQRDLPLSKTLDFLRKSQLHFDVEGKKVIVKK